jgi:hypothetical protein
MVTLAAEGAEVAEADTLAVAVSLADADAEVDDSEEPLSEEQPARPATTTAAPPTATRNPRFT